MNISSLKKPINEKLAKINEALDTLYGSHDTTTFKNCMMLKKILKQS